jgi:hypothetical protein
VRLNFWLLRDDVVLAVNFLELSMKKDNTVFRLKIEVTVSELEQQLGFHLVGRPLC